MRKGFRRGGGQGGGEGGAFGWWGQTGEGEAGALVAPALGTCGDLVEEEDGVAADEELAACDAAPLPSADAAKKGVADDGVLAHCGGGSDRGQSGKRPFHDCGFRYPWGLPWDFFLLRVRVAALGEGRSESKG